MVFNSNFHGRGGDVFWGEISPCEHLVQIYNTDHAFIDTLESFVADGLRGGESAIVIATSTHLQILEQRLTAAGFDVAQLRARDQYVSLDAGETLQLFMKDDWPDEQRFVRLVRGLLACARRDGRKVRAFGEMVAVMWARGQHAATVHLEHLWHRLCGTDNFSLLCAYPRAGFTQDAVASINEICAAHSMVLSPLIPLFNREVGAPAEGARKSSLVVRPLLRPDRGFQVDTGASAPYTSVGDCEVGRGLGSAPQPQGSK
jgi:hypothetical protein